MTIKSVEKVTASAGMLIVGICPLVIVMDPMLATGNSATAAIGKLKGRGAKHIRFVCLVAAPEGVSKMRAEHPDVPIWTAALDSHLNEVGYIVPGLGDAGDRLWGTR